MPAGRVHAVSTQIDAHAEASRTGAPRLVLLDFWLALTRNVPDVDTAVVGRGSQVLSIFAQRQRPSLTGLVGRRRDLATEAPFAGVTVKRPELHLAAETSAGSDAAVSGGSDVVAP